MISLFFSQPLAFLVIFPGLLISLSLHELAHCWITDKLGDPTPRAKDRLTFNPKAHLDPLGTIAILFAGFGWGKPAPVDPYNLKNPIKDMALIAAAGPLTNIIIATLLAILLHLFIPPWFWLQLAIYQIIAINITLAVFNLIPIYPLDGSRIITALLPKQTAMEYEEIMSKYGIMILIFLIFPFGGTSPAIKLLSPVINLFLNLLI